MNLSHIDHLVITTKNVEQCIHFYTQILNMSSIKENNRYALKFGDQKINIHTKPREYLPAAKTPMQGSLDICFVVNDSIESVLYDLQQKDIILETNIVERIGALGKMKSIYLRDPDGNLIELSSYDI